MALAISSIHTSQQNVLPIQPKKEKLPEYHCASCNRCLSGNHCEFFNRYVEPSYNRCWSHTQYIKEPDIHYVSPPNSFFKEIQKVEARKFKENNMMR